MDVNLAELSRTIDPEVLGTRLRNARIAAGLTQRQLAGGEVSTAYVSRIEAGQRRPELGLLGRLAQRAGTTTEELLLGVSKDRHAELRLALDHAELALTAGDPAGALAQVEEVLAALADVEADDLTRPARYVRAFALEATGDVERAIDALEELVEDGTADLTWLRGLIALSRCYREAGDLAMAIDVGERAATTIEQHGLAGLDEAVQLALTVAAAYFERGDITRAARICRQAIEQAERLELPRARASAYWNASIMASRQGALAEALELARRAMAILEDESDARNLARLRTELGVLQLRLDPPEPESAREVLQRAQAELDWSSASPMDKAENRLALARANLLLGESDLADEQVLESYRIAAGQSPLSAADALVLQGQIAAGRGRLDDARSAYRSAIQVLSAIGADRRAAELWFEIGGLLHDLGDAEAALDAYRRAAVSAGLAPRTSLHELMTAAAEDARGPEGAEVS